MIEIFNKIHISNEEALQSIKTATLINLCHVTAYKNIRRNHTHDNTTNGTWYTTTERMQCEETIEKNACT